MTLHLVTFCSHQPFLHLFHKCKLRLDIILLPEARRFLQNWDERVRPLPDNFELIDLAEATRRAKAGRYQAAMAHNISDYMDLLKLKLPLVLVMHTSLSSRILEERSSIDPDSYRQEFASLVHRTGGQMVFVTQTKRADWQLEGPVIVAGIDPDDYPLYSGELPRLLRVTNHLKQRGGILGYSKHRSICGDVAIDVVGDNPGLKGAQPASSWDNLKHYYQTRRAFLHTAIPLMEDGFNLAVMEAMATGMPIISTANPTSPIIDGHNGYISDDLVRLKEDVAALMADTALAKRLGLAARDTVKQHFHFSRFAAQWQELLETLIQG